MNMHLIHNTQTWMINIREQKLNDQMTYWRILQACHHVIASFEGPYPDNPNIVALNPMGVFIDPPNQQSTMSQVDLHKWVSNFFSDLNHTILDKFLRLGVDDENVNLDHGASSTNQPRQGSINYTSMKSFKAKFTTPFTSPKRDHNNYKPYWHHRGSQNSVILNSSESHNYWAQCL